MVKKEGIQEINYRGLLENVMAVRKDCCSRKAFLESILR